MFAGSHIWRIKPASDTKYGVMTAKTDAISAVVLVASLDGGWVLDRLLNNFTEADVACRGDGDA